MNWFMQALQKYAVFTGRARRTEYWMFALFYVIGGVITSFVDVALGTYSEAGSVGVINTLFLLVLFVPSLAVTVRRLHDTGRSGTWIFIGLIPLVGFIAMLIFTVQESEMGINRYGPNPKTEPQFA